MIEQPDLFGAPPPAPRRRTNVTETSRESFRAFVADGSHGAIAKAILTLLSDGREATIEKMAEITGRPQSTVSGVLRPLVVDGKVEHADFSKSKMGVRVRTWRIKR